MGSRLIAVRALGFACAACALALGHGCGDTKSESRDARPDEDLSEEPISARLDIPDVIVAGDQAVGDVVVENNSGQTVRITGCGRPFQVRLHREDVRELDLSWSSCAEDFLLPMGESRWPVFVDTTLVNPDGVMPPGDYEARIIQNTTSIPAATADVAVVERA